MILQILSLGNSNLSKMKLDNFFPRNYSYGTYSNYSSSYPQSDPRRTMTPRMQTISTPTNSLGDNLDESLDLFSSESKYKSFSDDSKSNSSIISSQENSLVLKSSIISGQENSPVPCSQRDRSNSQKDRSNSQVLPCSQRDRLNGESNSQVLPCSQRDRLNGESNSQVLPCSQRDRLNGESNSQVLPCSQRDRLNGESNSQVLPKSKIDISKLIISDYDGAPEYTPYVRSQPINIKKDIILK